MGKSQTQAFENLQPSLGIAIRLSYYDPDKTVCIFMDASDRFWSGVITETSVAELRKPLEDQRHYPLSFLGSEFQKSQLNWATFEKEGCTIYQYFKRMDYLLVTHERTHVFTDHRNLLFVYEPTAMEPVLGRRIVSKI